jgi:hypothetical protein
MATNWAYYYVANEVDGGDLQALFEKDNLNFVQLLKGLLRDAGAKFACTLIYSGGAKVIMISNGRPDEVEFFCSRE